VQRFEGRRGPVWRAKYRLPDGRQVQRRIGPAWTGRGRPPAGYFTKRTAEDWLRGVLDRARAGMLPGMHRTGVTVADACDEFLAYVERERQRKPSTLRDYRSILDNHVRPVLGDVPLEELTSEGVEDWAARLGATDTMSNRTKTKVIVVFHGVMERARRVHKLPSNLVADIEKPRTAPRTEIQVFSPEEVLALVRAAEGEQDAAIYLTAAYTGLRQGELLALRWRDIDFTGSYVRVVASYTNGHLTTPKSGKVRSVPMAPDVASALARLASRSGFTDPDDLVFSGAVGTHLDASALVKRYRAALRRAGLRRLRFHDLRHTFGTRIIAKADIRRVQEWMGHANIETTMQYLHYAPRPEDAALVGEAFDIAVGAKARSPGARDRIP
jgi:integrase